METRGFLSLVEKENHNNCRKVGGTENFSTQNNPDPGFLSYVDMKT